MIVLPTAGPAWRRLIFLDALRGVAALAVLVRHAANPVLAALGRGPLPFDFGQFGVLIFFLISGFVIPISLERTGIREFWIKHVFRLYPLYWFSIAIVIALASTPIAHELTLSLRAMSLGTLLLNLTMVQSLVLPDAPSLRGVYWTLARRLRSRQQHHGQAMKRRPADVPCNHSTCCTTASNSSTHRISCSTWPCGLLRLCCSPTRPTN